MPPAIGTTVSEERSKGKALQKQVLAFNLEAAMRKMIMMALAGFLWRKINGRSRGRFNDQYMGRAGGRTMRRGRF